MTLGLRGDKGLLGPALKLARLGQCQTEIRDIARAAESPGARTLRFIDSRLHQPHNPTIDNLQL
jgi:hypothetical protein